VKALLGRGADAKAMGPYALSVLEYGVASGNKELVKAILAAGADVNARAKSDATALSIAEYCRNENIVKILKEAGAKRKRPISSSARARQKEGHDAPEPKAHIPVRDFQLSL
jgi:ankyrin repeat protein